jgi:hypothetical protein
MLSVTTGEDTGHIRHLCLRVSDYETTVLLHGTAFEYRQVSALAYSENYMISFKSQEAVSIEHRIEFTSRILYPFAVL